MGDLNDRRFKRIFVTVGTTNFEDLIKIIDTEEFQRMAYETLGTREILAQIGNGTCEPKTRYRGIDVKFYRLKPDIKEDMASADLILTHCGAGSVTEAMKSNRPTVAVVNDKLMDNHQTELSEALVDSGPFIFSAASPAQLLEMLPSFKFETLKKYTSVDLNKFSDVICQYIVL